MRSTDKQSQDPIAGLDSKPNAQLPAVAVPFVLTANNAVELGVLYRQKYGSKIIALVPAEELRNRAHIQESFVKSRPDEIVILSGKENDNDFVRSLGLTDATVTILGFRERNRLMIRALGLRVLLVMIERLWFRGIKYIVFNAIPDVFGKREMQWLSGSVGLDAIFYAMQKFPRASAIVTAGVGLQAGGHFGGVGEFTSKTAKADRTTMKYWAYSRRRNVFTTDDLMHEIGKVLKWRGEAMVCI